MQIIACEYVQRTGRFSIFDFSNAGVERYLHGFTGYAGRGRGKNQPCYEDERNVGPLPSGLYRIGQYGDHPRLGEMAFPLHPLSTNTMWGRSGFFIHGDSRTNPGNASHGCIVLGLSGRIMIAKLEAKFLIVVPGPAPCAGD